MPGVLGSGSLREAVALGERVGFVFLVTSSDDGIPHLAVAGRISGPGGARVVAKEWFCPITMANVRENPAVAMVVWDRTDDTGYQMVGRVVDVRDLAMVDGYAPGQEPVPQVERELVIRVADVLRFRQGPHSDVAR